MPKFEFDISLEAPTKNDAMQKMQCIKSIGAKLSLNELQILANTVSNPALLAKAKKELGL